MLIEIFELLSRFHLTDGTGLPDARHFNVTFAPSRTTTSVDVNASSIFGGTRNIKKGNSFTIIIKKI